MRLREIDPSFDPQKFAIGFCGRGVAWLDGDGIGPQGRWSFLGCDPVEVHTAEEGDPNPFAALAGKLARDDDPRGRDIDPEDVPAWIGLIEYDACFGARDMLGLRTPRRLRRQPTAVVRFARYDALIAIDHRQHRAFLVGDDDDALDRMQARLHAIDARKPHAWASDIAAEDAEIHRDAIERALSAIARGELYQINLARRWTARFEGDPIALFIAMRKASPVPFGAYLERDGDCVLARTMERFLRWNAQSRIIETRPIKGTLARSGSDDRAEADALRTDEKERAEHAMIVDLMRNDLGRVAEIGSVQAIDVMEVEPYAALSHLVSTVRAKTKPELGIPDILTATFPPGSITGTPKLRAIEMIEALERHPRGAYCGAIGHIDRAGGLSLVVAIRTATITNGQLEYFAGGGLVEASIPAREVAETELKARVLLDALKMLE